MTLMTKGVKDQAQYHSLLPIMFANVFLLGLITPSEQSSITLLFGDNKPFS